MFTIPVFSFLRYGLGLIPYVVPGFSSSLIAVVWLCTLFPTDPNTRELPNKSLWIIYQILPIMDLILTMSPSSSEAERGFSQLKLIKTNLRSKLRQSALNHCMGIRMLAPDIKEYDPHPAIHYWNSMSIRARRTYLKDHIKTKVLTLELQTPPITASGDCDVVRGDKVQVYQDFLIEHSCILHIRSNLLLL